MCPFLATQKKWLHGVPNFKRQKINIHIKEDTFIVMFHVTISMLTANLQIRDFQVIISWQFWKAWRESFLNIPVQTEYDVLATSEINLVIWPLTIGKKLLFMVSIDWSAIFHSLLCSLKIELNHTLYCLTNCTVLCLICLIGFLYLAYDKGLL